MAGIAQRSCVALSQLRSLKKKWSDKLTQKNAIKGCYKILVKFG